MHIYIDESGGFIPLDCKRSRYSALGALVVPSGRHDELMARFEVLRASWGMKNTEPKGSQLQPREVSQVIELLREFDVIFDAVAVDVGLHSTEEVSRMKLEQGEKLLEFVTRDHHPNMVHQLCQMRDTLIRLPNQLFIQVFLINEMISSVLEMTTMYYAQREPVELGRFVWVMDAKDTDVTPSEELWRMLVLPVLQTKSLTKPHPMVEWGDYSHFDARFYVPANEMKKLIGRVAPEVALKRKRRGGGIDIKKILRDDFTFGDSRAFAGLQLVDVLTSAVTRALNGAMLPSGWRRLGQLMVRRASHSVRVVSLSAEAAQRGRTGDQAEFHAAVLARIDAEAKAMLKLPHGFKPGIL